MTTSPLLFRELLDPLCRLAWPDLHWCEAAGGCMSVTPGTALLLCTLALLASWRSNDVPGHWLLKGAYSGTWMLILTGNGTCWELFALPKPCGCWSISHRKTCCLLSATQHGFHWEYHRRVPCAVAVLLLLVCKSGVNSAQVLEDRSHTATRNNYLSIIREPCVDHWEILTAGNKPILNHQSNNQCLCKIQWYF